MRCIIQTKVKLIQDLNKIIPLYFDNIEAVEYKVFTYKDSTRVPQEYLVITYEGGSRTVRNCNGNSFSAILQELTRYLNSGYYAEVRDLIDIETSTDWIETEFSSDSAEK